MKLAGISDVVVVEVQGAELSSVWLYLHMKESRKPLDYTINHQNHPFFPVLENVQQASSFLCVWWQ